MKVTTPIRLCLATGIIKFMNTLVPFNVWFLRGLGLTMPAYLPFQRS